MRADRRGSQCHYQGDWQARSENLVHGLLCGGLLFRTWRDFFEHLNEFRYDQQQAKTQK